jgi:PAS domain S-box-containing protein
MIDDVRRALQTMIADVQQDGRSLDEMVEASRFAVLVTNDDGLFVMANPAACTLIGGSRSDVLKLSVWQITPDVHEREAETLWRAFRQQSEQFGTYRVLRVDGRTVVCEYAAKTNIVPGFHVSILSDPLESLGA